MEWIKTWDWGDVPGWLQVIGPVVVTLGTISIALRKRIEARIQKFRAGREVARDQDFRDRFERLIGRTLIRNEDPQSERPIQAPVVESIPLRTNFFIHMDGVSMMNSFSNSVLNLRNAGNSVAEHVILEFDHAAITAVEATAWESIKPGGAEALKSVQIRYPAHTKVTGSINWNQAGHQFSQPFIVDDPFGYVLELVNS